MKPSKNALSSFLDQREAANAAVLSTYLDDRGQFNREKASEFLENRSKIAIPDDNAGFLNNKNRELPSEFQIPGGFEPGMQQDMLTEFGVDKPQTVETKPEWDKRPMFEQALDYPAAFNQEIFKLIGLPGDLWDVGMKLTGLDQVIGLSGAGSDATTDLGARLGASYRKGEEPDTAGTKMGQYTALGLEFLAPFLRMGRAGISASAIKAETEIQIPFLNKAFTTSKVNALSPAAAGSGMAYKQTSVLEGMSQAIAAPFQQGGKMALAGEIAGSSTAGLLAQMGGEAYGDTGEFIGGLIGGPMGQLSLMASPRLYALGKRQLFPYTAPGGKMKGGERIRSLLETDPKNVQANIDRAVDETLPGSNLPVAKLSGDRGALNLQNRVLENDSKLRFEFIEEETRINELARDELKKLGTQIPIEETQAYLKGRIDRLTGLIDRRVDLALITARDSTDTLNSASRRSTLHANVDREVLNAHTEARVVEKEAWKKVKFDTKTVTTETQLNYKDILDEQTIATDKTIIPDYVTELLGKMKDGKFVPGTLDDVQEIKTMQDFRTTILNKVRDEKAKDAPNWNKVRILDSIQEALLKDMSKPKAAGIKEAVEVSRKLNEKFKGGIMQVIFGHEKTGGRVAPEIALETINAGPKAAVEIKRILNASPQSFENMENVLKLKIASPQAGIVKDGRLNADKAKKYMDKNEDVFDIFPDLKSQMEKAIGLEERAVGLSKRAKTRQAQLAASGAAQFSKQKPGRAFQSILDAPYPAKEFQKIWSQSNARGKNGLVNDGVTHLIRKSKMGKFDDAEVSAPFLDGKKLSYEWDLNKKIYTRMFTPAEQQRVKLVINTLKKNAPLSNMPARLENIVDPGNKVIRFFLGIFAVDKGGNLTSGAGSLKSASMAVKVSNKFVDTLDTSTAEKFITDAIQDRELWAVLMADSTKPKDLSRAWKVYQGWMVGTAVDSLEEK